MINIKNVGKYKKFQLYEVTERDIRKRPDLAHWLGDVLVFLPDSDYFEIGYEEMDCSGGIDEAKEFIDSYEFEDEEEL